MRSLADRRSPNPKEEAIIRRIRNLVDELSLLTLYPLFLLAVGILIHVNSLIRIAAGSEAFTVWAVLVHVFMLAFNIIVLIGLVLMKRAAYVVVIAGFLLMAATWTIDAVLRREINLSTLLGIMCCAIAVPVTAAVYRRLLKSRNGVQTANI